MGKRKILIIAAALLLFSVAISETPSMIYPGFNDIEMLHAYITGQTPVTKAQALEALANIKQILTQEDAPDQERIITGEFQTFIVNMNTSRFHKPDCKYVADILPKNKREFYGTHDELIHLGYRACGYCDP